MSAAAHILFAAAISIWLGLPAYLVGAIVRDHFDPAPPLELETTPEWLAILAATEPTPIYDRIVCEQIERREWAS